MKTSLTLGVTMDVIEDIVELLKEGYQAVEVDKTSHKAVSSKDIKIDTSRCIEILGNKEIQLAIDKRFKGKKTLYLSPGFKNLVVWCLATDSYKVCEKSLDKVSNVDIESVWQFIDTISVSSTEECRNLVSKCKGVRSSVGFSRSNVRATPQRRPAILRLETFSQPSLMDYDVQDSEGFGTLEEVQAHDCVTWALKSSDPLDTVIKMRSGISERNQ
jgi:hypothetical protein